MSMEKLAMTTPWAAAACTLTLLAAAPAAAQLSQNSDAPVDITADALEVVNNQCLSIWSGSAEALQDRTRLRADVLKTFSKKGPARPGAQGSANCGALSRMEATGNVYYVTAQQRVRGDAAVYDVDADTIVITGDVVAVQGQNVLRGQRLTINATTGNAQMQSNAKGRGANARPRAVIYPSQSQAGQTAQRR
jgi:lipopolysaccharide export system protein LptA